MSYCRFSSNNYDCDVYAWEDISGKFMVCVAGNRFVGDIPKLPRIGSVPDNVYSKLLSAQNRCLRKMPTEDIGLPYDGDRIVCDTEEELRETFVMLRDAGYRLPDYLFDDKYWEEMNNGD